MQDRLEGAHAALNAIANQFATMCHERWLAEKRIRALKFEMVKRAAAKNA